MRVHHDYLVGMIFLVNPLNADVDVGKYRRGDTTGHTPKKKSNVIALHIPCEKVIGPPKPSKKSCLFEGVIVWRCKKHGVQPANTGKKNPGFRRSADL